jgi:Protein of unknown function (DUF3108)
VALLASLLFPGASAHPTPAPSDSSARPFAAGERLTYTISWLKIRAGSAVMEVKDSLPIQGRPTLTLTITAKTNSFISTFYPVENRVESAIDAGTLSPHRIIFHRREGKRKNDFDVTFHHAEGTVTSIKDGVANTLGILPGTQDAISCLYYLRSLPSLRPGSSLAMTVHHDQKNYRLEVQIEAVEKVKGPWGEVEALRVLAVMPFQGIFLNEGNIRVWLTNDAQRVPVMMKAKVIIGSVVARLVDGFGMPPAR